MSGNIFGTIFKITTFGESHGPAIGVVVEGCPAGLEFDKEFIQFELSRRRPGQSAIVTQRKESDEIEVLSGIFNGKTTGTPVAMLIRNLDHKSQDYNEMTNKYRPSHADYTYDAKYGIRDPFGGGRSSARETAARVAAGALAKLLLKKSDINITAYVSQVGHVQIPLNMNPDPKIIESNPLRCPDTEVAEKMEQVIREIRKQGDTIGGKITCIIHGVPPGVGEPVFDKLHADLAKAIMSINAVKGFEYGSGFGSVQMKGSEHNDIFENSGDGISTKTNYSGGIQGGISNGMPIYFNVAFKPVATIMQSQETIDNLGNETTIEGKGRHDPCVVPRAVPIVEAMAALVLADHILRNRTAKL